MAISGDYTVPVMVNGYSCRNCTDVANAQKQIDPAHPGFGPDKSAAHAPAKAAAARVSFDDVKAAAEDARRDTAGYSARGYATATFASGLVIDLRA